MKTGNIFSAKRVTSAVLTAATAAALAGGIILMAVPAFAVGPFNFTAAMKLGSNDAGTGGQVSMLQEALKDQGPDVYAAGLVTGYFGPLTKAAVIKFQEKYASDILTPLGLTGGTGFVGASTRAKLNTLYGTGTPVETDNSALIALIAQLFPADQQAAVLALLQGLLGTGTPGATSVPTTGNVTIALAADSPSMPTMPDGSGNQVFTKVTITNGTASDVKLTGVKITRFGNTVDNSFDGVKVWDSSMNRHGSTGSFGNNIAQFAFASDPITIKANSSDFIYLVGDLNSSVSGSAGMSIEVAADLTFDGTVTVDGVFPVKGHEFTVIDGASVLGSLTVDVVGDNYTANLDVGSTDNIISDFKLIGGSNEKTNINKIVLNQRGTITTTDYKNIKLVDQTDGTTVATVASPTSDNRIVFDFATPFVLNKGQTKNFWVKSDISSGSSRTIQFSIETSDDVVATGASTGAGIIPAAGTTDTAFPIGIGTGTTYNKHTINSGDVSITKDTNSPSSKIVSGALADLALFTITASGEDIEVRDLYAGIGLVSGGDDTSKILTFGIYDENNNSMASPKTSITASETASQYNIQKFTLSPYAVVSAGGTKKFKLRVELDGTAIVNGDTVRSVVNGVTFKRISSNNTGTNGVTTTGADVAVGTGLNITGNTLTVDTSSLSVAKDTAYGNQTFVTGAGSAKIGQWTLTAGPAEGVNITSFTLSTDATNNFSDTDTNAFNDGELKNVKLFKSDGTQLGSTSAIPTNNVTFTPSSFSVAAGQSIAVYVTADISSGYSTGNGTSLILAGAASGTGQTSARSLSDTAKTGQTMTINSTGGTLTLAVDTTGETPASIFHTSESGIMLSKIRFTTDNVEAVKVTRLQLGFVNGSGNVGNVYLYNDAGTLVATQSVVSNAVDFQGLALEIPISSSRVYTVKVDTTGVGTLDNDNFFVDPLVRVEANGLSSGVTLKPTPPGTSALASTNWNGGGTTDIATGNLLHISGASSGATTPGYYVVTTVNGGDDLVTGATLSLNGTATQFATTDRVTKVTTLDEKAGNATAGTIYNKGDLVYVFDDETTDVAGFAVVTTGVASGAAVTGIVYDGLTGSTSVDSAAADRIVRVASANVLGGKVMLAREAEPEITLNSGSPSGSTSPNSDQIIAKFDIKAVGSRDITVTSFKLDKVGGLKSGAYVRTVKVYNGDTQIGGVAGTTTTGTGNTVGVNVASTADLRVGATVYIDTDNDGDFDVSRTVNVINSATQFEADSAVNWTVAGGIVSPLTVTFDSSASTAWTNQTITSGGTLTLTVRADTSSVKGAANDLVTQGSISFGVNVGGTKGPTATDGYVTYQYTTYAGSAFTGKTEADQYPVNGGTLSY